MRGTIAGPTLFTLLCLNAAFGGLRLSSSIANALMMLAASTIPPVVLILEIKRGRSHRRLFRFYRPRVLVPFLLALVAPLVFLTSLVLLVLCLSNSTGRIDSVDFGKVRLAAHLYDPGGWGMGTISLRKETRICPGLIWSDRLHVRRAFSVRLSRDGSRRVRCVFDDGRQREEVVVEI